VIILGDAEIDYIVSAAQEIAQQAKHPEKVEEAFKEWFTKEKRENLKQLARAAGLDAALFGRMVTSDSLARGDAAIHVAHAFTVHQEFTETDYFSAVDDLEQEEGALGSGHIGNTELTSGLFYGYVVIDVPLLIDNLGGDNSLAEKTIEHFIHLAATISPGAKRGSTAPYARAGFMMIERGATQPRSLGDAFLKVVSARSGESMTDNALQAFGTHLQRVDAMYGAEEERAFASYYGSAELAHLLNAQHIESLDALANWASKVPQ
jgi:CRISPR system Cascade subunit CasC